MKWTGVKKHGFALIELLVATMIATLVAGVLLAALSQSNRSQAAIDNAISLSERIGIVTNQLEKDLMGAFVPVQAEQSSVEDALGMSDEDQADEKGGGEKKAPDKKNEQPQKENDKKKQKPIEKIFYSTNKNGMLDALTFVTNNPLVVFVGKDVGEAKPKVVRVQYSLKPEDGKKDSYGLFRQESMELDLANYKNVRMQEVIGGIKNFTIKFIARIEKKEDKQKSSSAKASADTAADMAKEKPKISYEYKEMSEWVSEQKKEASKQEGKDKDAPEFPRIPYAVECKITLWDQNNRKNKDYTIVYEIPVDSTQPKKQEKSSFAKASADKQPESNAQKGKPGAQNQPPQRAGQGKGAEVVSLDKTIETLSNTLSSLTKLLRQM